MTDLDITATSQGSVTLSWTPNGDADFIRYEIYRSTSPDVARSNSLVTSIETRETASYIDNMAMVQPDMYYYRIWVVDQDDNVSRESNEIKATYDVPGNGFPFTEDGSGTDQWSRGFPWGLKTILGPAGTETSVWTDSPVGNYSTSANTSLATFVDLGGTTHPVLQFWHRYFLEENADYVRLQVSTDGGGTWTTLRAFTGAESEWNEERIDLTAYAGNGNFGLRFLLEANGSYEQDGWYMDDLTIGEGQVEAAYPFTDTMESGNVPWVYGSPWGIVALAEGDNHAGTGVSKVWTDSPDSVYTSGVDASLQLTIDLGTADMPVLSFYHRYSFDTSDSDGHSNKQIYDYGYVEVQKVGTDSWTRLYFVTGTSAQWLHERVDLSNYAGEKIHIRFRIKENGDIYQSQGWFIDDIRIDKTETTALLFPFSDDLEQGATTVGNWHSSSWGLIPGGYDDSVNAFTDSPASWYAEYTYSPLIMANSIDLSNAVHPILTFWHKYNIRDYDYEHDKARVWVSTDNGHPGTWHLVKEFYGDQAEWTYVQVDLSDNRYKSTHVRVKFEIYNHHYRNPDYNHGGWTIDDIRLGEDESIPSYILKASGDNQVGQTGTELAEAFVARIYDSTNSQPRSGILAKFTIESGNGSLSSLSKTSGADGLVSTILTLGSGGANSVKATIDGAMESVIFTATGYEVGQPKMLSKVSGDNQVNTVDLALANPLVVKVTDLLGDPVENVDVTFRIDSGEGTGSLTIADPVSTDSSGIASNTLTLGGDTGTTVIAVSSLGLTSVTFRAYTVLPGGTLGDDDGDGMPNDWEANNDFDSQDPSDGMADPDMDDLSNYQEYIRGTDPYIDDSDNDGMPDGWEVRYGLDPLDDADAVEDSNSDGQTNLEEYETDGIPIYGRHFKIVDFTGDSVAFYGYVTIGGIDADIHDEVAVLDADGVVCGKYTVDVPGQYGYMHVYGDDPTTTGIDEGADPGDELTFRIWDVSEGLEVDVSFDAVTGADPPSWTSDGDISYVNLAGEGKQIIPLHQGWNLISFSAKTCYYADGVLNHEDGLPSEPMLSDIVYLKVGSIADVFSSIEGSYEVVRSFDGKGPHTFDPANPSETNLKYVAGGYGYWIKMKEAGNLEVNGMRALPSDTLQLREGWNLVGYWHTDVQYTGTVPLVDFPPEAMESAEVGSIDDVLSAQSGNYNVIRSYDTNGAHTYDPMLGDFNDLDYLGPGYGIWIRIKSVETQSTLNY